MTAKTKKTNSDKEEAAVQAENNFQEDTDWQAAFLLRTRLRQARIPARFQTKTFDSFKIERSKQRKAVLQAAKAYVDSFNFKKGVPMGLFMTGSVGCGKTHMAVAVLQDIIAKGYTGLYYNMVDLLADIRATYSDHSELSEGELLREITEPDLIVLDDLGAERTSGWVNERLYLIINRRYESGKPVLVTTNLGYDELSEKLGRRTVSRLCEICETSPEFPDEDYRRKHMR